eukprot:1450195-Amphidinium_carterae.1
MLESLTQVGANSGKIHATFQHQTPSFYGQLMSIISAMDQKSSDLEGAKKSESSQSSRIVIDVGSDSEITVTVKKARTESTVATAATSATSAVAPSAV